MDFAPSFFEHLTDRLELAVYDTNQEYRMSVQEITQVGRAMSEAEAATVILLLWIKVFCWAGMAVCFGCIVAVFMGREARSDPPAPWMPQPSASQGILDDLAKRP